MGADLACPPATLHEHAIATHQSEAYQAALVALSDGVERDFRIIEGID